MKTLINNMKAALQAAIESSDYEWEVAADESWLLKDYNKQITFYKSSIEIEYGDDYDMIPWDEAAEWWDAILIFIYE